MKYAGSISRLGHNSKVKRGAGFPFPEFYYKFPSQSNIYGDAISVWSLYLHHKKSNIIGNQRPQENKRVYQIFFFFILRRQEKTEEKTEEKPQNLKTIKLITMVATLSHKPISLDNLLNVYPNIEILWLGGGTPGWSYFL